MLIENNMKNALLKLFLTEKSFPTFLSHRLPNGPALSCGAEKYQVVENELSSC